MNNSETMKTYKIAKGWGIFIYITAPLLIALFVWLLCMPWVTGSKTDETLFWILAPISIGMIALMVIGLMETIKSRFVIGSEKIYAIGTFSKRELMINEIKGYRKTDNYIFIESNNKKKIKISTYFGKINEIEAWLSHNFSDLDIVQAYNEKAAILNNETFGRTSTQRSDKLQQAFSTAKILNWAGALIGAWTLFIPKPYNYAIMASIALPIICLIVVKKFRGLIRIDEVKGTAYPTIILAVLAPCITIGLRSLLDYNIYDYSKIWTPVVLVTLTFITVFAIGNKEFKFKNPKDYLPIFAFSIFMFCYAYGAVISLNCIYDKTAPETFNAIILNKRISTDQYQLTTYYLELTPWGSQKKAEEVSVSKKLYNKLNQNEVVNISFRKGKFDIPWFEVTE